METSNQSTGIAIFAFNRPDHLRNLMNSLELNKNNDIPIYVFLDGYRNSNDRIEILKVKNIISEFSNLNIVEVYESSRNRGLSSSIRFGIDRVLEKHDRVIVLEDDIVVSSTFFDFMAEAFDKYECNLTIGSITGYRYHTFPSYFHESVVLGKRHCSWGWGTWKNRWERIDWEAEKNTNIIGKFSLYWALFFIGTDYFGMLRKYRRGQINSWSILFDVNAAKLNWFCLQPKCNLVINNGMDGTGTNYIFQKHGRKRKMENFQDMQLPLIPKTCKTYGLLVWLDHLVLKEIAVQKLYKYIKCLKAAFI